HHATPVLPSFPTRRSSDLSPSASRPRSWKPPSNGSAGSLPTDLDPAVEVGERQRRRLLFHREDLPWREITPGGRRDPMPRSPPGADQVAVDEDRSRPDTRSPQLVPMTLIRDQIGAVAPGVEQPEDIPAGQEAGRCGRVRGLPVRVLVPGE